MSALNWLLSKLPVFAQLNGYKTVIAVSLLALTYLHSFVVELMPLLPDVPWLSVVAAFVVTMLSILARVGEIIGVPLLATAAVHNKLKEKK